MSQSDDSSTADKAQPLIGLGRRRQRLSDEETERRMLEAATAQVNQTGLTVSLDHLSFEEIIRDAGVSRSTVYRRWPYKDLFFSDLLKELARAATPAAVASASVTAPAIEAVLRDHLDWFDTPDGRRDLLLEVIRIGAVHDFELVHGSVEWRTYLALHATFLSVADDGLRGDLRERLAASERAFVERIAASWQRICSLFGFRLRPELDATFQTIAAVVGADLRGAVLMALANPELVTRRVRGRPFGASHDAEWSPHGIAIASIAWGFLEPDPTVEWDADRIARVRATIESGRLAVS
jgi:AcrR family transcriptional regulator